MSKIREVLMRLADYYGRKLTKNQLDMYVGDLSNLTEGELEASVKEYRLNPKNAFFPLPAQLLALASKGESTDALAHEVPPRIWSAVSKFGWCNPKDAQDYIGEIGWEIVKSEGGWKAVCENSDPSQKQFNIARWRDRILHTHRSLQSAVDKKHERLEYNPEVKELVSNSFGRSIGDKRCQE